MIILKNKGGVSSFDEGSKIVTSVYKGRASIFLAKEHLRALMEFYNSEEAVGAIVNISGIYGSFSKLLDYLEDEFYPYVQSKGLKAQAYVVSDDLILSNLSKRLSSIVALQNIAVKIFKDEIEAEKWLKTCLSKKQISSI